MAVRKFDPVAESQFHRFPVVEPPKRFRKAGDVLLILVIDLDQPSAYQVESDDIRIIVADQQVVERRRRRRNAINDLAATPASRAFADRAAGSAGGRGADQGEQSGQG